MNQYIITDKEHNRLWILLPKFGLEERRGGYATVSIDSIIEINEILQTVGSHPYQSERDIFEILVIELDSIKSRIESSAMGQPLSERSRGEIIGLLDAKIKIEELRLAGEP